MIDAAGPWGTGPFVLATGVSQLDKRSPEVVMEPNKNYWDPARKPTVKIVFDNIMSKADALRAVAKGDGEVDLVTMVTPEEAKSFKSDKAKIVADNARTFMVGVFNTGKDGSPLTDAGVRKALNMAIDRKALVEKGANGYGVVTPALIQEGRFGAVPGMKPYEQDAAKATEALKGKFPDDTVALASDAGQEALAAELTAELEKVGLKVKKVEYKSKDFDIKLVWHFDWSPEFPLGVVHREFFGEDGAYRAGPTDPELIALWEKVLAEPDHAKQEAIVQEYEKHIYDNASALFMFSPNTLFAVSNRVTFQPYDTFMLELAETKQAM